MTEYSDKRLDDKFDNLEKKVDSVAEELGSIRRLLLGFLVSLSIVLLGAVAAVGLGG